MSKINYVIYFCIFLKTLKSENSKIQNNDLNFKVFNFIVFDILKIKNSMNT